MRKRAFQMLLVGALALLHLGCNAPGEKRVRADFLAEHPGVTISDVYVGEGDGDHAYYHIEFTRLANAAPEKKVWLYQRQAGAWVSIHRKP